MLRFRTFLPLAAALVGAALLGAPTAAHAGFSVEVFEDNTLVTGGSVTVLDSQDLTYAFTSANSTLQFFKITSGSGSSNNPGSQTFGSSMALANNTKITTNFGTAGGTHSIQIVLSEQDWMAPTGSPLVLDSSAGGSYHGTKAGNSVTSTYQGFLDPTNTLFGTPAGGGTPLVSAASSALSGPGPFGTQSLVYSPATSSAKVPAGTPFSMTDILTFTFTEAAGSGQDTVNASASTVATTPAPSGVILALVAVPFLGLGAWMRRRRLVAV